MYTYVYYRQETVEVILIEKLEIVEKLANSVGWLKQPEYHMNQQASVGNDFSQVQSQYLAHKVKDLCMCLSWTTLVVHNRDRPEIHGKPLIERTQTMPKK